MKKIQRLCVVTTLTLLLAQSAIAGQMSGPSCTPPPEPPPLITPETGSETDGAGENGSLAAFTLDILRAIAGIF